MGLRNEIRVRDVTGHVLVAIFLTIGSLSLPCLAAGVDLNIDGTLAQPYPELGYPWENNGIGITDRVPPPWTDLTYSEKRIGCWGRDYILSDGPLPSQIMSQGQALFKAPPSVDLLVNGISPNRYNTRWIAKGADRCSLYLESSAEDFRVEWSISLEYDGFFKIDGTVIPQKAITIDRLILRFPFHRQVAMFYSRFMTYDFHSQRIDREDFVDSFGRIQQAGQMDFNPALWVGNYEVGMEWVCETNEGWSVQAMEKPIRLFPDETAVLLEIQVISKPLRIDSPYRLSFAIYPTPVRKMPDDWRRLHLVRSRQHTRVLDPELHRIYTLARAKELGESFPGIPLWNGDPEKKAEKAHSRKRLPKKRTWGGLGPDNGKERLVPYASLYGMPARLPGNEWKDYDSIWRTSNPAGDIRNPMWAQLMGIPTSQPSILSICPYPESFRDFHIWYLMRAIKEKDIDGVYIDLASPSVMCRNEKHPHGRHVRQGGSYYPFFHQRELMKRIYVASKELKPDFLIAMHHGKAPIVVSGFSDLVLSGEALNALFRKPGATKKDIREDPELYDADYSRIPAEVFEVQYSVRKGFISMLLPQIIKENQDLMRRDPDRLRERTRSLLARTTLYDIPVYPVRLEYDLYEKVLEARKRFGWLDGATYVGPWDSPMYYAGAKGLKVSMYLKPNENKLMIAVANLTPQTIRDTVRLDPETLRQNGFHFSRGFQAVDAMENRPYPVTSGGMEISLPPDHFLLWIVSDNTYGA